MIFMQHFTNLSAAALLCLTLFAPAAEARQQSPRADASQTKTKPPISKDGLLDALRLRELTTKELVEQVERRGVAFEMGERDEAELRAAGALSKLIEAVRDNYRAPINREALLLLVKSGVLSKADIVAQIEQRGMTFPLTPEAEAELRAAGATPNLLAAVRANHRPGQRAASSAAKPVVNADPTLMPPDTRPIPFGDPQANSAQPPTGPGAGTGTGDGAGLGPGRGGNTGGGDRNVGGGGPGGGGGGETDYSRVFKQSEVTRKPVITLKPEPGFTEEARRNNVEGFVRLRAVLGSTGEVRNISVIKGLPDGLTEQAIAAARRIRFRPAEKDGRAVSQWVTLEYNFHIYYREDEVGSRVRILEKPAPEYTEEARRDRVAGKVVLNVMFTSYGVVNITSVERGLPLGLTEKAVEAARRIKFTPAQVEGRSVTQLGTVEYDFTP
jgi:TonB family protein